MIIQSLNAENLLKYRRLRLTALPENGVIAISGSNESGKSTIGESLCFALFGRSFSVERDNIQKLIRWGEGRCSVTLQFSHGGQSYEVTRLLDRDGNHAARLVRAEQPDPPLARGVEAVDNSLADILGFEYDEFVESFYLAQRELTTPHPHSYTLKVMAGIAPLEYCQSEFDDELAKERAAVDEIGVKLAGTQADLQTLAFDPSLLPNLERDRISLGELEQGIRGRREPLVRAAGAYQQDEPRLRDTESRQDFAGLMRTLFLLAALLGLGFWALITQQPGWPLTDQLQMALDGNLPGWREHLPWFLFGGGACALLCLVFWIRSAVLGGRVRALRDSGQRLAGELAGLDDLEAQVPADLATRNQPGMKSESNTDSGHRSDPEIRAHLRSRIEESDLGGEEAAGGVARETAWLDQILGRAQQRLAALTSVIATEIDRAAQHQALADIEAGFQSQLAQHQRRIQERELANELASSAIRFISHRFNHHLRELVSRALPLFTESRYQHLQINQDLSVRAFSNEKRDFLDLDEISSGTQRQIMLALRLALTQGLIDRLDLGRQFLFLDEPFALFDEARTRNALVALPKLSAEVSQIWVIAQQFPEDLPLAARIRCTRETENLLFAG